MTNTTKTSLFTIAFLATILTGCGSESAGNNSSGTGFINLDITDAPIDSAAKVVVAFSGVTIKPANASAYDIDFVDSDGAPIIKTIDLLSQQGANSEPLLVNHSLDAGHYNWIRLKVLTSESALNSYIELDGGLQHPLYIPGSDQTGLKLNQGFDITDGSAATFIIDFDLRKSIVAPMNPDVAYKLRPTLRIVNKLHVGHINGHVGADTLNDANCTGTDYAVYAFTGDNIIPDDVDGLDAEPVSTALLSNNFDYAIGFLNEGIYTLAFTCQASNDDSETDDVIKFFATDAVTVNAGTSTLYNFN